VKWRETEQGVFRRLSGNSVPCLRFDQGWI
jgi:hypothetical protein